MASPGNGWDELSKLVRKLEVEVDFKLSAFTKIGSSYGGSQDNKSENDDSVPLLSAGKTEIVFDKMAVEIQQLLDKLSDVNNKMSDYIELQGKVTSLSYNLQRHREILNDYYRDFHKTKSNIQGLLEREDLFRNVNPDRKSSSGGLTRRSELYLKENEHLRSSERMVDEQINIALETKEHMLNQRATFKSIQGKINTLASN
ncbi:Golgi SNAP receptor complex member 1, variant 2 [Chamberlinius hualienensis]